LREKEPTFDLEELAKFVRELDPEQRAKLGNLILDFMKWHHQTMMEMIRYIIGKVWEVVLSYIATAPPEVWEKLKEEAGE